MNIGTILEKIATFLVKAQEFAGLHRIVLALAAEVVVVLLVLWGLIYRPRTCIVTALAAFLLYRYGPNLVRVKGE